MSGAGDPPAYIRLAEALVNVTETIIGRRAKNLGVHPQMPLSVLARIWIGEHIALLNWWLHGDAPYSVEQLALMRMRYHVYGPEWAHGIEPGEWVFDESLFGPDAEVPAMKTSRPRSRAAGAQPNRRSASSR